jgi:hypothetical protein
MEKGDSVTLNGDIPKYVKLIMLFIDRVGFPVLAFILMFYLSYSSITKLTCALTENSLVLKEFKVSSDSFQREVNQQHMLMNQDLNDLKKMSTDLNDLKVYSYGYRDHVNAISVTGNGRRP